MKLRMLCVMASITAVIASADVSAQQSQQGATGEYIHYRLAVQFKNERNYDKAIEEFRKVLSVYPDHYDTYMHLAEIRRAQGNHKLVIYNLRKALSYNPGWSRAQLMLATALAADGQLEQAIREYQTYMSACDPAQRDSLQTVINRLTDRMRGVPQGQRAGDAQVAAPAAQPATKAAAPAAGAARPATPAPAVPPIRLDPRAEEAMKKVVALYNEKKYDDMLKAVREEVLAIQNNHPGAYYYAGLVRKHNRQMDMARINFQKALPHPVHGADARRHLDEMAGQRSARPSAPAASASAQRPAEQTAAAVPDTAGVTAVSEDRYAPIEVRIDSMLSMMTVDTLSDAGRKILDGIRAFKAGRYDDALREFRRVLAENPNGPVAAQCLYNAAICYFRLRLFRDAENQFQLFLNRFPSHAFAPQAQFFKAVCYQERGDYTVSERLFRQFIQNNRNHAWVSRAYERLGDSYADLEQHRKAMDAYVQALAGRNNSHTDRAIINYKLGMACEKIGDKNRAITYYQAAIDAGERNNVFVRVPDSYYKIADLRFQQREFGQALDTYKYVTRKYPAFQETPWGLFQIAGIHRNMRQYREAVDTYTELMQKFPDDYWAKQAQWKLEDTRWEHEYRGVRR